ncbi:ADP-specific phosphofructokinase [Natronorubrum bangense JCM 10635]|uniref:ADP-specific phosphofructokinase n=1 Tax=Natronorubrum bangense JCM 10635 TaxID=1227500 RepID=L9W1K8_9EURY|nr:ADP-specific phosphofructokinase [Natronorubrum bangense JCM 10635]
MIDQVGAVVDGALLAAYHNLTPKHVDETADDGFLLYAGGRCLS